VNAFLVGEPGLLPRRGYGSVAAEAYGVTGSIVITPVLEVEAIRGELKNCGGHGWPAFKRWNCWRRYLHSTLRLPIRFEARHVTGRGSFCSGWGRVPSLSSSPGSAARRFLLPRTRGAELMVLTQGWVNAVSIGIVGAAVARLWKWPSWWNRYRAGRK
jgi:hypothetical protein